MRDILVHGIIGKPFSPSYFVARSDFLEQRHDDIPNINSALFCFRPTTDVERYEQHAE